MFSSALPKAGAQRGGAPKKFLPEAGPHQALNLATDAAREGARPRRATERAATRNFTLSCTLTHPRRFARCPNSVELRIAGRRGKLPHSQRVQMVALDLFQIGE